MRKRPPHYLFLFITCLCITAGGDVSAQLTAQFSSNTTQGCSPLVVRFKDESTGNPTSWKWDLGNGTISYFQNPAASYFNPGTYTVKLIVSNGARTDSIIKLKYITVFASPLVNFAASDTGGCYPLKVDFTDLSIGGDGFIIKWLWDFGDGSTDSIQQPQHIYNSLGDYNVSLQVKNNNGCISTLTRSNYIKLDNGLKAGFTFTSPNSCKPPTTINFTNQSTGTGVLNYQWEFGDGTHSTNANPSHAYNGAGTYTVKLIVRNNTGCLDSIVKHQAITIGTVDADFTAPAIICAGQNFQMINRSQPNPTASSWNFGDGTTSPLINPNKTYFAGGNYVIKLVSDFGACKDSTSKRIQVLDKPVAFFTALNIAACRPPLSSMFNCTSAGSAFKWFFGDGDSSSLQNPSHIFTRTGDFDVKLIVTNSAGCTDTLLKPAFVRIHPPHAAITNAPQEGCAPFTYSPVCDVQSVDSILNYQWDFGDGSIENGLHPAHIYNAGTYTLKLIILTAGGCTDTVIVPNAIRTGNKPQPAFSATPRVACAFQSIKFSDLSTGSADSWLWYFGDGSTSTEQYPNHFYQDTGYFNVSLIVGNNGCKDSIRINNYIYINPPIAKFIDSSGCSSRFTRKFIDRSIGATSWFWDFGDGTTSAAQDPIHTYLSSGTYTVQLTVKNDSCEHSTSRQIQLIAETADFTASDTSVCKGSNILFETKNVNTSNIALHQWSFGDGLVQYGSGQINHIYSRAGNYDVALIITDLNGCIDSLLKPLYIHVDGPTADFNSNTPGACLNAMVIFNDRSAFDGLHAIQKWIWNYGDGIIDSLDAPPFQHMYAIAGNYTVTLSLRDTKGCRDSIAKRNVVIISDPKASFNSPDTLSCTNKPVRFTNNSAGPLLSYKWEFGDGLSSTITNPLHSYSSEGLYSVKLKIVDQYGCSDSLLKNNYIFIKNPVAQFSMSDSISTCPPLVVNFFNQSQHYIRHEWDFGDGTKSNLQNPIHFYTYPGSYHAKLTVISIGGCIDSIMKTIVVRGPEGSFNYDRNSGCVPTTLTFVANTKDMVAFIWDFNDGETILTSDSAVSHTYTRMGEYLPKMILKDPQGCQVPIVGKDTIKIYGVNAKFGMSQQLVCDSGRVFFTDSSISNDLITNYYWSFGDGTISTTQQASHIYHRTGNYPISLVVTTQHNCRDTAANIALLRIVQSPVVGIRGDTAACVPAILRFNGLLMNADTSALRWQWNFGNNISSVLQDPLPVTFTSAGNFNVRLVLTNSSNCADTANFPVVIHPSPEMNAGDDAVICRYQQANIHGSGAINFKWSPGTTLSCTDCASPIARPDATIRYFLQGENIFGCKARDSVLITVKQPFKITAGSGDTLCKGETYLLQVSGAELYSWSPVAGLDNPASSRPKARPDTTTLYRVVGSDDHNCFTDTGYTRIIVYPYPLVEAGKNETIPAGSSINLAPVLSNDVKTIRWTPDKWLSCYTCPNPVAAPRQTTRYTIEVTNQGGCVTRDDITLFVICESGNLFMPNTFSPNGDGINDVFYPRGKGIYGIRNFRVFDRWGELVFEQTNFQPNDAAKGWNGNIRGKLASQDVYVYTIDLICENNVVFSYKGNVTLIR